MRDPRRALAVALACLVVAIGLLVWAGSCWGQGLTVGGKGGVGPDPLTMVWPGSPQCGPGVTDRPPAPEIVHRIQACVSTWFCAAIADGALTHLDGTRFQPDEQAWVDGILRDVPCITWYDRPVHVWGWSGDPSCQPCWICAHGQGGSPCIGVALDDRARVLPLTCWETADHFVVDLGRWDQIDGPIVAQATRACVGG